MISLRRILVATDFSPCASRAVEYACELADRFSAELHLLHVVQDFEAGLVVPGLGFPPPEVFRREVYEKSQQALEQIPEPLWCEGKVVIREICYGSPFAEIIRSAQAHDVSLIVLGTHGRTGLLHALLGSVAEKVVRKASCPVLTVRPKGHQFVTN